MKKIEQYEEIIAEFPEKIKLQEVYCFGRFGIAEVEKYWKYRNIDFNFDDTEIQITCREDSTDGFVMSYRKQWYFCNFRINKGEEENIIWSMSWQIEPEDIQNIKDFISFLK